MPALKKIFLSPFFFFSLFFAVMLAGCGVYKFADVSIPANVKSVRITNLVNRAPYVNTQLAPTLSDRLRQKIVNQTRLTQTNRDNVDYDISGEIRDYSVTTSGITSTGTGNQKQASINRLTVAVHITLLDNTQPEQPPKEFDVSRSFEFSASLSLQAAESQLLDEMIKNLTDDIFNRLFSNW